jgi:transcriptional regulator with XRE-family HTH domain
MNMIELGVALKEIRLQKNIKQADLCTATGLSRATLSRLENGRLAELGIRKMMVLCDHLGMALHLQTAQTRPTLRTLVKELAAAEHSSKEVMSSQRQRAQRVQVVKEAQ